MQRDKSFDKIFRSAMVIYYGYLAAPAVYVVAMIGFAITGWDGAVQDPGVGAWLLPVLLVAIAVAALRTRETWTAKTFDQSVRTSGTVVDALSAAHVLRLSINETVAILGLGLFLALGNIWVALPVVAVGFYSVYQSRPDKARWQEAAAQ